MSPQTEFILDGSVCLAWYFQDEADDYADAVRDCLVSARALVPSIWPLEIANTLWVGERRGRSTAAQATAWLSTLRALPITIDEQAPRRAFDDILSIARSQGVSAYDSAYLELAMRRQAPLATLDARLRTAARAIGIAAFEVTP